MHPRINNYKQGRKTGSRRECQMNFFKKCLQLLEDNSHVNKRKESMILKTYSFNDRNQKHEQPWSGPLLNPGLQLTHRFSLLALPSFVRGDRKSRNVYLCYKIYIPLFCPHEGPQSTTGMLTEMIFLLSALDWTQNGCSLPHFCLSYQKLIKSW